MSDRLQIADRTFGSRLFLGTGKFPSNAALRGAGSEPRILTAISGTFGPDRRTTPIPPRPAGVAIAAMVSSVCIVFRHRAKRHIFVVSETQSNLRYAYGPLRLRWPMLILNSE